MPRIEDIQYLLDNWFRPGRSTLIRVNDLNVVSQNIALAGGFCEFLLPVPKPGFLRLWENIESLQSAIAVGDIVQLYDNASPIGAYVQFLAPAALGATIPVPLVGGMTNRITVAAGSQTPWYGIPPLMLHVDDDVRVRFTPAAPVAQTMSVWGRYLDLPV